MNIRNALTRKTAYQRSEFDPGLPGDHWARTLNEADRSCCCSARPVVVAVLTVNDPLQRLEPTDLLLCGHHYRRNRATLSALVAMVYRQDGSVVTR